MTLNLLTFTFPFAALTVWIRFKRDAVFAVLYFWHAQAYDNLKKKAKKMAAAEKIEVWKMGGGSAEKKVDSVDEKLLATELNHFPMNSTAMQ